ncbi:hypothetical protein [Ruegeria sp. HKCCD6157]|uniref:hypothetical protein n=1 Tax=Ruegeria sp. HKCCD6157 TaxID=2690707 RepID=UPI001491D248|nr:hypothetical protein [Ruegeria sp. HKCCD6157]NOE27022.1 hypothetical protein [Ruegeria sp. HKCCD6157]
MSEKALSEATMLASLRDIHLPAEAAGGAVAEYAAVLGIAALASVGCVAILRLLSVRTAANRRPDPPDRSVEQPGWSVDRRRVALLHKLRTQSPKRYAELTGDLYQPGGEPDLATLQEEVAGRV